MTATNSRVLRGTGLRSRLAFSLAGFLTLGSTLILAAPTSASISRPHAVKHARVVHWLSSTPQVISPRAIHQTFVVDSSFDPLLNTSGCAVHHPGGSCTLRDAIYAASHDTVNIDAVTIPSGRHLVLTSGLTIQTSIIINGTGAFVNAMAYQAFMISSDAAVTINGLTVTNGSATNGGALYCQSGSLLLNGVNFNNSYASVSGGAIYETELCNLWIDNSTFVSNTAGDSGGALYTYGNTWVNRSTFGGASYSVGNDAPNGAGIYNGDGSFVLTNSSVKHNTSASFVNGAGVYNDESMDISNCAISYNSGSSGGLGGGIYNNFDLNVTNSFINNNFLGAGPGSYGAAAYNAGEVLNMANVTMTGNSIHQTVGTITGGAVYTNSGMLNWTGGSVASTQTVNSGGGISGGVLYVDTNSKHVTVTGVAISSTLATSPSGALYGGVFYFDSPGAMSNVQISGTTSRGDQLQGGAIASYADWSFSGVSIAGTNAHLSNSAGGELDGGAVYLDDYSVVNAMTITNTTARSDLYGNLNSTNQATIFGGVLYSGSESTVNGLNISGGTITAAGGSGSITGGGVYNYNLATFNNTQVLGLSVNSDSDVFGGLFFNADHIQATNFTLGNSTVNVNLHHTSVATPSGDGTIMATKLNVQDQYNLINATISNITTTVTGGSANWGMDFWGKVSFTNSSIANITMNGPTAPGLTTVVGVESGARVTFHNSIVASAKPWQNCHFYGLLQTLGFNIDNGNSCGFHGQGDQVNASPKLMPLSNNGGLVFTSALKVPGSAALNKGSNVACPSTDARGVARPQGGVCDVGAYEYVKAK